MSQAQRPSELEASPGTDGTGGAAACHSSAARPTGAFNTLETAFFQEGDTLSAPSVLADGDDDGEAVAGAGPRTSKAGWVYRIAKAVAAILLGSPLGFPPGRPGP